MKCIFIRVKDKIKVISEDEFILQDVRTTIHRIEQILKLLGIKDYDIKVLDFNLEEEML